MLIRDHRKRGKPSSTYMAWADMRKRCRNPKNKSFARYGGRGINICVEWETFERFLADMGEAPPGLSLDRINNDGNYEPGNCRWATRSQQASNTSLSAYVELNGTRKRVRDIEVELGLSQGAIWHRIKDGWQLEAACTTPKVHP